MSEPVTQAEIESIREWCAGACDRVPMLLKFRKLCLKLLRAIAERDETIKDLSARAFANSHDSVQDCLRLELRDAREDLANYRASAEEQLRLHKEALRWAMDGFEPDSEYLEFSSPAHLREILMESVRSKTP